MEYELKKKEILSQVEFTNLLSFSLVENKLQRNFKNLVEAITLTQIKTDSLNQDHLQLKQSHSNQILKINQTLRQINEKLQNLSHLQNNNHPKNSIHSIQKLHFDKDPDMIVSKKSLQQVSDYSEENQNMKSMWDQINQKIKNQQKKWDEQKSELTKQIQNIKDNLDLVGFLQNQLKNFRIDLRIVKEELSNNIKSEASQSLKHNTSNRSIVKRQSILNMISAKVNDKGIQQTSKNTLNNLSKQENKENIVNGISQHKQQEGQQNSFNQGFEKQINLLYLQLNTIKVSFEQLRDLLSDSRKQTFKNTNLLSELKQDLNRQIKTRKTQNSDLQNSLKDLKMQMLNIQTSTDQPDNQQKTLKESAKTNKMIKKEEEDINHKNQLNDKISKIQALIQNLITSTEFNRLKNYLNDQIEKLTNKVQGLEENVQNSQKKLADLILQYRMNMSNDFDELKNQMNQMQDSMKNESNQNERKNNIVSAKIQEIKKSLQNLREDLEFYQSFNNESNKFKSEKKSQEKNNDSQNDKSKTIVTVDDKGLQGLKKYFSGKMHDIRTNLLGLIRDLEKKLNNKSNGQHEIVKIWDKLNELNLFMNKKADQDDAKKTFIYLEKKINRLSGVLLKNEQNTDDARIARSNQWHCLSCDKNLSSYQGKIGKHMVWDSMPLKGINKSFVNQTDDKKKGLPQLKK